MSIREIRVDKTRPLAEEPESGHNRWHPDISPVARLEVGDEVVIETRDAVDGQIGPDSTIEDVLRLNTNLIHLVATYNAILGTCHLSPKEIVALVIAARDRKIEKIVVTHPFFKVPNLEMDTVEEVARLGAYLEFGYCTVSPAWHYATPEKIVEAVHLVGSSRCMLVSDTGQRHNPLPHEALRIFAQTVFEKGVNEKDIDMMIRSNPSQLLDLTEHVTRESDFGEIPTRGPDSHPNRSVKDSPGQGSMVVDAPTEPGIAL